jgi:hypothetical protein
MDDDARLKRRGSKQLAEKEAADQAFVLGFSCEVTSSSRAKDNDNDNNIERKKHRKNPRISGTGLEDSLAEGYINERIPLVYSSNTSTTTTNISPWHPPQSKSLPSPLSA